MNHPYWENRERIGITGSRFYVDPQDHDADRWRTMRKAADRFVDDFVQGLDPKVHVLVTGAAKNGVDDFARVSADMCGIDKMDFPANWNHYKGGAGHRRNALVVAASQKILAVWDGESRGTADTISKAIEMNVPVRIMHVADDGDIAPLTIQQFHDVERARTVSDGQETLPLVHVTN